ncbi:hypothetical protein BKA67DRAFT_568722 [Truncatella angustata]|uniref:FAD-binding domain-containing protein n=1 Tax=Truncatella angustata TaxID=152316 RepID=A0A9P8UJ70_9PEZI|nr:uncharacterized protein BKA67DRAFT_568722 [Truncatella angustata]KAH6653154.1 hypothetical protein BKA67DRAFT_568722 [Truncatella angustata]
MADTNVLIIGCGVAGPVLALLLQAKGFNPIVFEKVQKLGDAGASLMLMPNGMKVLGVVGLAETIYSSSFPIEAYQDYTAKGDLLGSSILPGQFQQRYGQKATGIKRTTLNLTLKDRMLRSGIELREGRELCDIQEDATSVTACFTNGERVRGLFLVGCDGIKGVSRSCLLKRKGRAESAPIFTGLTQIAGMSPLPQQLEAPSMRNWYGEGVHVISYPVSRDCISWAVTLPQADESPESWRLYEGGTMQALKEELSLVLLKDFEPGVIQMVQTAERLLRYGLFDRATLEVDEWNSSRCVLVGDAAHPTSPHLGQGANQALEDCFHLSEALGNISRLSRAADLDQPDLLSIFRQYARRRQPRTAALVKGARAAGEKRVVTTGMGDCEARNRRVAAEWQDIVGIRAKFDGICKEPFEAAFI